MNLGQADDVESASLTRPPRGPEPGRGRRKDQVAVI
jgi:hypothetical protein